MNDNRIQNAMDAVDRAISDPLQYAKPSGVRPVIPARPALANPIDTLAERGKTHGEYTDLAKNAQLLKAVMMNSENWKALTPVQKESLELIATKIARILSGDPNARDHWQDIAGYAMLVAQRV